MPAALIAPIIMAASAATSAGLGIYSLVNQPSAPKPPSPAEMTQNAIQSETQNRTAATQQAAQFLPALQANTSGGLSPDAYQQLSANFSGNANIADSSSMQQLIARFLGLDTGSSFGTSSQFGTSSPASPGLVPNA